MVASSFYGGLPVPMATGGGPGVQLMMSALNPVPVSVHMSPFISRFDSSDVLCSCDCTFFVPPVTFFLGLFSILGRRI